MVLTRSSADPAAVAEQRSMPGASTVHHAEPPRSPSDRPAEPSRVELPSRLLPPLHEDVAAPTTVQRAEQLHRSPAASRRSSTASAARLRVQLELEAQERLADISRRELRLEADLVKKRLALELETVDIDDRSCKSSQVHERVNEWLEQTNMQQETEQTSYPAATTSARQEAANTASIPRPPCELRGEHLATPRVNFEPPRFTRAPTNEARRSRSPTPTRTSRGIEQLAQVLEKLARGRPPPRQAYELPAFSGAPNEWLPFKAAIRDTTQLYNLSPAENLARLRTCLKGEARDTVAALLHTASSPEAILNTLEQCYGRPEMIVDRALEDLRRLPKLGTNANELNSFAIKVQNIVTVLENVDRKGYLHNPLLVREILDKLSPHLRSRWCDFAYEHRATDMQEVVTLSRFLMREANLAVRFAYLTTASTYAPTATAASRNTAPTGPARNRTRGVPVYTATDEEKKEQECSCCGDNHRINACRKLRDMDIGARWEWAKAAHMCFRCLEAKHRSNRCRTPACGTNGCRRPHHPLLHNENRTSGEESTAPKNKETEAVMSIAATNEGRTVLLKVCSVTIAGPAGEVDTFALLDEGSTVTLLDQELANSIGAVGTPAPLNLRGVNATEKQEGSQRVSIAIRGRQEPTAHKMTARTFKNLELRQQSVPHDISRYAHLKHIKNACFENAKPRVLIGADNWHLIVSRQLKRGRKNEPAASRTDLGWVIYGHMPRLLRRKEDDTALHVAERREESSDDRLHELVKKHFAVDALGVSLSTKVKPDDQRAVESFERTARRVDNHYEVGLPWRTDDIVLPPNYCDATRGEIVPRDRYDRWFSGPAFLYEPEDAGPQVPSTCPTEEAEAVHHVNETGGASALPDISRFSSFERLIRATATVLAFIDKCRKTATCLELRHLERAEKLWMAQAQRDSFSAEIQRLKTGRTLLASSRLAKLDPVMQDGLLRVRGRINAAHTSNDTKRPVILDGRHPLTRLIVLREHAAAGHANNERVLNDLRQRLWILRARPTVRAVARACALCKVRRAMPRAPPTGDLPPECRDPDKGRSLHQANEEASRPPCAVGYDESAPGGGCYGQLAETR